MTREDQHTDLKSLRTVTGKSADWAALAQDCVCFANGAGGRLLIGIEDGQTLPPADQVAPVPDPALGRALAEGGIQRRIARIFGLNPP